MSLFWVLPLCGVYTKMLRRPADVTIDEQWCLNLKFAIPQRRKSKRRAVLSLCWVLPLCGLYTMILFC